MIKFGSVLVPTSAVVFLSVVIVLLIILIIALMILNKVLCFANCNPRSSFFIDNSDKLLTDSESDDSDEDIYNNYAHIEKTAKADKSRASIRSITEKDKPKGEISDSVKFAPDKDVTRASIRSIGNKNIDILEELDEETSDTSRKDSLSFVRTGSICRKITKISIIRVHLFFDNLSSKLKIQISQIFDLIGIENRIENKKPSLLGGSVPIYSYQLHCSVLPDKKYRFKTKIKQGVDPLFNETFYVSKVKEETVSCLSIRFRLYGSHTSTLNVIGQCVCDLSTIDLSVDTEYNLTMTEPGDDDNISTDQISISGSEIHSINSENPESPDRDPELMIGLSHNSNTGRLTVEIVRGTSLSKDKNKDFYVKLSMFSSSGQELSHTKTSVRKNTTCPIFRESFMFQVALFQMKEVTLMVSVFAKKSVHRKDIIGWLSLGYKSSGEEETNHWSEIMEGVKSEVIRSHRLHQNSNPKKFIQ